MAKLAESRKRYRALHDRYCKLLDSNRRLLSRWGQIQYWYETADRSPQSWAELDKIMQEERHD